MLLLNKKSILELSVTAVMLILAGLLRVVFQSLPVSYNSVLSLIYLLLTFRWFVSVRRRFSQKYMRGFLTSAAIFMMLWAVLREVRFELVSNDSVTERYLWYLDYVPLILIPMFMFLSTLYLGKTDSTRVSKFWQLLFIPYAIIILLILTNDIHQLAFSFSPEKAYWDVDYKYRPVYYLACAAFAAPLIGILIVAFKNMTRRRFLRYIWLPLLVITVGELYYFLYITHIGGEKSFLQSMYEMPEFTCIFLISFWESLVITRMIPSNIGYEEFFEVSSINGGLADNDYNILLHTRANEGVTPALIRKAQTVPVVLNSGNTLLKGYPVKGGHFYWMEDVSEINRLNKELADTADYLLEEREILESSARLDEEKKRAAEQNRLFNQITQSLKPQLDALSEILDSLPADEEGFRSGMKRAAVLNAYIKRRANLMLMAGTESVIRSGELEMSISESFEYARLLGIECFSDIAPDYPLEPRLAIFIYELFEDALEAALLCVKYLFVSLSSPGGGLKFYMELDGGQFEIDAEKYKKKAADAGCELLIEQNGDSLSVTLEIKKGGDGV